MLTPLARSVEGFGIVYLDAGFHGKPVVGYRSGGASDFFVSEFGRFSRGYRLRRNRLNSGALQFSKGDSEDRLGLPKCSTRLRVLVGPSLSQGDSEPSQ